MSQLEVDKIIPSSGTTLTIGDSGDTINISDGTALTVDTNTLAIDQANNRVGIGTSSPLAQLHIQGSDITDQIIIENTNSGAETAPDLTLYRNSSSPADSDTLGNIIFRGRNDNSEDINYFEITAVAKDVSDGTEDTQVEFATKAGGSNSTIMTFVSNKIGIGTNSPDGSSFSASSSPVLDVSGTRPLIILSETDSNTKKAWLGLSSDQFFVGGTNTDTLFYTNNSEKMRIQSNGRITTFGQSTTNGALNLLGEGGSSSKAIVFAHVGNGAEVGSISTGTSSTSYNTSSDYRLKENIVEMTGATERLKQLSPKRFNFISNADTTVDGFLAHEVSSIVPEAVSGEKDAMRTEEYEVTPAELDEEGNIITQAVMGTREVPDYQGIDQSKLVPLLVATIKELEARIEALENA